MGKIVNVPFGAKVKITQAKKSRAVQRKHYRTRWPIFPGGSGTPGYLAVLTEDLPRHGGAEAAIFTGDPGSEEDSGDRITVNDFVLGPGEELGLGTRVMTASYNGNQYVIQAECTPSQELVGSVLSAIPSGSQSSDNIGGYLSGLSSDPTFGGMLLPAIYSMHQTNLGAMLANA